MLTVLIVTIGNRRENIELSKKRKYYKKSIDSPVKKEGGKRYNLYNTVGLAVAWDAAKEGAAKRRVKLCSDVKVFNKDRLDEPIGSENEDTYLHTESKWKRPTGKRKKKRKG
jgi:hypothetical protein